MALSRKNGTDAALRWEAVQEAFTRVYSEPGTYYPAAQFENLRSGLNGFGVYPSPHGYLHIVTCGLTSAKVKRHSTTGIELTIKWPNMDMEASKEAFYLLDKLALMSEMHIDGIQAGSRSWEQMEPMPEDRCAQYKHRLIVLPDTEVLPAYTKQGSLEFLQVIGISPSDAAQLKREPDRMEQLTYKLKRSDEYLSFCLTPVRNYLSP